MEVLAPSLVLRALTQNYTSHSHDINVPTDRELRSISPNNRLTSLDTSVLFFKKKKKKTIMTSDENLKRPLLL